MKPGDFTVLQGKRDYKDICDQTMELSFWVRDSLQSKSLQFICTK